MSETPISRQPMVAFIYMPWATTTRPSLALGILTQLCSESSVPSRTIYANMDMAARIGYEAASGLANERALYGLSEHLFACDMFGANTLMSDEFLDVVSRLEMPGPFTDKGLLRSIRDEAVPAFLDEIEERVVALAPTVVGFSSTFNQVVGSLALGRRLKRRLPDLKVIAGGACFDGEMGQEYHRALPEALDHVFMGEAEDSFRTFLRRHVRGESTDGIPGITFIADGQLRLVPGKPLQNMNDSPMPDFDEFFFEKDRLERETGYIFNIEWLPFESSRGCWWGQNKHCVFCGINDELMTFREKDPARVISEILYLTARYRVLKMTAADWIISKRSRKAIFSQLAELGLDIECFYETRADLSKEELRLMKEGGVLEIQPGIESFSTELLELMGKQTSRIRHVQFLRWAKEYRIHLSYNVLAGFPGEKLQWYLKMAEFLPRIFHLQPPLHNMHYVEMHRFAPLFERREEFGVDKYELREDYAFNFPPGMVDGRKIGYFFSYRSTKLLDRSLYSEPVREVVARWMEAHEQKSPPVYEYSLGSGFLEIKDTRFERARILKLAELHHDVFLLCDKARRLENLRRSLSDKYPTETRDGTLDRVVDELLRGDLLMQEGDLLLTLPIGVRARTTDEIAEYVLGEGVNEQREENGRRAQDRPEVAAARGT